MTTNRGSRKWLRTALPCFMRCGGDEVALTSAIDVLPLSDALQRAWVLGCNVLGDFA
jgi:hypothetical protein